MTTENPPATVAEGPSALAPKGAGKGTPSQATALALAMSMPLGAFRTEDHRYYFSGRGPYPSVTTVLGVLDKPAMVGWAKRTVAEFAVRKVHELEARILANGPETVVAWLASLPEYQRNTAAQLGSGVHHLADMAARGSEPGSKGFEIPDEALPYIEAFRGFLARYGASNIVSSEKQVISFRDGYAGTYDMIMQIDGELWMVDLKTGKGVYPEVAMQIAAYGYAQHIMLEGDPQLYPMPKVDRYGVLHLRPDKYPEHGWRLIEYEGLGDREYQAFCAALDLYQWKQAKRFSTYK